MSDTSAYDDEPAAVAPTVVQPLAVTDVGKAQGFLRGHKERAEGASASYESIMKQRQDAVEQARTTLDATIQEMRDKQSGKGPGQMNLPLLALAAGLTSTGNFGDQLSRGLTGMGKTIQGQRMQDADFVKGIAELQQKSASLSDVPLKDAAMLQKQRQLAEEKEVGSLEGKIITAKMDKPTTLGSGIIWDPRADGGKGAVINAITGQKVGEQFNEAGKLIGSDLHGDAFLEKITDPVMRKAIKGFGDYDANIPTMGRTPQSAGYQAQLFALAKQYNPDFDEKQYSTIQKGMKDWTGNGTMAQRVVSAATIPGHIADLQGAAAALNNVDFTKWNNLGNFINNNKGDPRVVAFEAAKKAVMTEIPSFLGKGHPAEGQIREWQDTVSAANSPAQLQAAMKGFAKVMHTQLETMAEAKSRDLGGKKQLTPDDLIGKDNATAMADVLNTDIATPGGRLAAMRRGQNHELRIGKQPPLPQPTPDQWAKGLEMLKKAPTPQARAQFDEAFGPGSAAMALGK